MGVRIVNVDPTHATREIGDTGQVVEYGQEVEVSSELADRLLQQSVWARPTTNVAKVAEEEAS